MISPLNAKLDRKWIEASQRIATLEQQNAELVAALECIAGYEHPFCTMPQDLQAIATEALSKVKQT